MEGRKEKAGGKERGTEGNTERGGRTGAIEEETVRWVGISTG